MSSSQRPLPNNTQHSQQTHIHAPGGIRTRDLSKRVAADLALDRAGTGTGDLLIIKKKVILDRIFLLLSVKPFYFNFGNKSYNTT